MLKVFASLSKSRLTLLVFLIALVLRIAYFVVIMVTNHPDGFMVYDSYGYVQLASNLVDSGTFSQSFLEPLEPDYFRTPVYPLFIAVFRLLSAPLWVVIVFQLIISSLTAVVILKIGDVLDLSLRASLIASLLFACEPSSICFSNLMLTETIFVFLFTLSLFFVFRFIRDRAPRDLYLFSLFFAVATLTRPAPVYLAFVIFPLFFFIRPAMWKNTLASIFIFVLVLGPWFIRNTVTFGKPFLTKLDDEMLLFYHASSVIAEKENITLKEAQNKLWTSALNEFPGVAKEDIITFAPYVRDRAITVIKENSGIYFKQHLYGILSITIKPVRGYFDAQTGSVKGYQSLTPGEFPLNSKIRSAFFKVSSAFSFSMVIVQVIILAVCYLFFYKGLRTIRYGNLYAALISVLVMIYFLNLVVPPFSEGRLRLPLMPLILIIGVAGLDQYLSKRSKSA